MYANPVIEAFPICLQKYALKIQEIKLIDSKCLTQIIKEHCANWITCNALKMSCTELVSI